MNLVFFLIQFWKDETEEKLNHFYERMIGIRVKGFLFVDTVDVRLDHFTLMTDHFFHFLELGVKCLKTYLKLMFSRVKNNNCKLTS